MRDLNSKVGEISISISGLRMTIIAWRNSKDIDVQFEDGVEVKGRSYENFKNGSINHPHFKQGILSSDDYYGYKLIKVAYTMLSKVVYYFCKDKNGNLFIATPQEIMKKAEIKPVF